MPKNIGSYHMKAFRFIKSLVDKYGEAFPSVPTLAKVAGCSDRYATAVVKDLVEWGYVKKVERYNLSRRLSNGYEIITEIEEPKEEVAAEPKEEIVQPEPVVETVHPIKDFIKAPLKAFVKAPKAFRNALRKPYIKREEDTIPHAHGESDYQNWFIRDCDKELGVHARKAIFPHVQSMIDTTKPLAWWSAMQQFKEHYANAKAVGPYFKAILENEIIKHQMMNAQLKKETQASVGSLRLC